MKEKDCLKFSIPDYWNTTKERREAFIDVVEILRAGGFEGFTFHQIKDRAKNKKLVSKVIQSLLKISEYPIGFDAELDGRTSSAGGFSNARYYWVGK